MPDRRLLERTLRALRSLRRSLEFERFLSRENVLILLSRLISRPPILL